MADFSVVKKGYDQDEVNEYIEKLEEVINSYKEKDIAIKNAIISAQIAADNIIENAEIEACNKRRKASETLSALREDINKYEFILSSFQADYNTLIKKYLTDINSSAFKDAISKFRDLENNINDVQKKISNNESSNEKESTKKSDPNDNKDNTIL